MTPAARFARIARNPSLFPGVAEALGPGFPWHTHAASPRSSQALCLSAWAPLAGLEVRHTVIERLLAEWLPGLSAPAPPIPRCGSGGRYEAGQAVASPGGRERRWSIAVEASDPDVLGERGGRPSSIDVVLESSDTVVCVESKFLSDARAGFRGCGQFPAACRGFHGRGSHRAADGAPCRLAVPEGRREARRYWSEAAGLFRSAALRPGSGEPGSCPLHRHYQLARTLLYAKALAERPASAAPGSAAPVAAAFPVVPGDPSPGAGTGDAAGRRRYAALVVVPAATAGLLERQTAAFVAGTLLPEHAGRVAVAHYEGLVRLLRSCGDPQAAAVGAFVAGLLPPVPSSPPAARPATARDLRRRAEAARRARPREDAGAAPRTMAP